MKKDKKFDQVSVEIPLFKDSIAHAISREKKLWLVCLKMENKQ